MAPLPAHVAPLASELRIRVLPGVWPPHRDAWLLAGVVLEQGLAEGRDVLDMFTGSGALAVSAAAGGAASVTAVDVSRRALLSVRLNAALNGFRVQTLRGNMFEAVGDREFDLIVANPPYIPGHAELPARGLARAWEGGVDGRVFVDRLIDGAPQHLRPGGRLLIVHSSVNGEQETIERLADAGLRPQVALRQPGPLGAVSRKRISLIPDRGLTGPAEEPIEETLVFVATRAALPRQPAAVG